MNEPSFNGISKSDMKYVNYLARNDFHGLAMLCVIAPVEGPKENLDAFCKIVNSSLGFFIFQLPLFFKEIINGNSEIIC